MRINRKLAAILLSALILTGAAAGYYFGNLNKNKQNATATNTPGVETTLCAEFSDTYEHSSKDVNHIHIGNLYAVNLQGNHLHSTRDYQDWLKSNLSSYAPQEQTEEFKSVSSSRLAGMMYLMYRWCRAKPMDPFVSVITAVIKNEPAPDPNGLYRDDPEGE